MSTESESNKTLINMSFGCRIFFAVYNCSYSTFYMIFFFSSNDFFLFYLFFLSFPQKKSKTYKNLSKILIQGGNWARIGIELITFFLLTLHFTLSEPRTASAIFHHNEIFTKLTTFPDTTTTIQFILLHRPEHNCNRHRPQHGE